MDVQIKRLYPDAVLPGYASPGDAGLDLCAEHGGIVEVGDRKLVLTGLAVAIPVGHMGLILPRSGLALKHGITVLNAPGLIDSGYRGELGVVLYNAGRERYDWSAGDRVAQLVILPFPSISLVQVEELDETERGKSGFGSTGS